MRYNSLFYFFLIIKTAELRKRNIPADGRKEDLINRLRAVFAPNNFEEINETTEIQQQLIIMAQIINMIQTEIFMLISGTMFGTVHLYIIN